MSISLNKRTILGLPQGKVMFGSVPHSVALEGQKRGNLVLQKTIEYADDHKEVVYQMSSFAFVRPLNVKVCTEIRREADSAKYNEAKANMLNYAHRSLYYGQF